MFRDMSNAIVSHIRLKQKLNNTAVNYVLGLLEAYKFGMKNYFLHKDLANYITLRLEDLHMDPDVCMKDLCERVGLEFTPSLLKATFMGKAWEYESAKGDLMREVQKEITYDALNKTEQLVFETMFAPLYLAAGYKLCTKADMSQSAICRAELLGDSRVNLLNLLSFHYSYEYSHLLTVPVLRFLERLRVLKPLIIFRRFVKNIVFILRYKSKKCAVIKSVLALRDEIRAANGRSSGAGSNAGSNGAQEAQGEQTAQDATGFMGAGVNFAGSNATRSSTGSSAPAQTRTPAQSGKDG